MIRVQQVLLSKEKIPVVREYTLFKKSLEEMGKFRLGIVCVVDENEKLLGIVTDGDIRRKLLKVQKPMSAFFIDDVIKHSIKNPITVQPETSLKTAVELMGDKQIWDLPVVDGDGKLKGLLHLHPAIKKLLGQD